MGTERSETISAHSMTSTGQGQNVRNTDVEQSSGVTSGLPIPLGRRREARKDHQDLCSYEMLDATEEESVVIEQGTAIALDRSIEGLRLFMRRAPRVEQMIEVRSPRLRWDRTVNVFVVRWTRPVQVESLGSLYLVGCRRMFGPCDDVSF